MSGVTDFYGFEFSSRSGASTELGRTQSVFKYVLISVNLLFLVFGCVLCALGAYAVNSQAGALAGASLPKAIIALGVFTIILSFLGCFASFFESRIALSVYFGVLLLICLLSFLVGIGVLVEKNEATSLLVQGWSNAGSTAQQTLAEALGCCGFYSFCDNCVCVRSGDACTPTLTQCTNCVTTGGANSTTRLDGWSCPGSTTATTPVCLTVLQNSFQSYYQQAGGAAIAFGVLMFAAMLLVCVLMRAIKQKAYLDSVRAQHKRIREAKEDDGAHTAISMAGLRTGLENTLDTDQSYARATRRFDTDAGSGYAQVQGSTSIRKGGRQRDEDEEGLAEETDEGQEADEEEEQDEEQGEEEEEEEAEEDEEEELEEEEEEEEVAPPPRRAGRPAATVSRPAPPPTAPQRARASRRGGDDDFS